MIDVATIRVLLEYTDWSNDRLLDAAAACSNEQLDRPLDVGPGTLRRIILHILSGEVIWLRRWQGIVENAWPDEGGPASIDAIRERFVAHREARGAWLATLVHASARRIQPYRDSKGTLYQATLGQMLVQGVMHSKHHQAQAVNALRRLGGPWPELDYMCHIRRAAD